MTVVPEARSRCGRRRALGALAGLLVPGAAFAAGACRARPQGRQPVRIPLAGLEVGQRKTVTYAGGPVDVLRTREGIVARSLLCTHFGCVVAWSAPEQLFVCSCHEGRYDAEGRPVAGPPPKPLRIIPAAIEGGEVRIG